MIQKLEILDETLNSLNNINNKRFSSEKFKEVNSQFEKILMELKSNEETNLLLVKFLFQACLFYLIYC